MRHVTRAWVSVVLLTVAACGDAAAPPPSMEPEGRAAPGLLASAIGTRAYVALEAATMPGADRVVVRAPGGDSARTLAVQGGFDPLAISASDGETVTVAVTDSAGRVTEASVKVAPRPPRVVRTSPAERRTDVPLNARVLVVFSVPMDSASTGARVRLLRAGATVPGRVELGVGGTVAEFVSTQPLVALTDYTIVVDGAVTDVRGTPMGEPVSTTFRTGSGVAGVASISLLSFYANCDGDTRSGCSQYSPVPGGELWIVPELIDARGQSVQLPVAWRSSDERVAQLSPDAGMSVRAEVYRYGTATVEATVAGLTATLELPVPPPVSPERLAALAMLEQSGDEQGYGLWHVPLDGSGKRRLASASELPQDPNGGWCGWPCRVEYAFAVASNGRIAIARVSAAGGVWVKDHEGAPPRAVHAPGIAGAARSPAWSPDGMLLAYWFDRMDLGETELRVVGADGSGERIVRRIPLGEANFPIVWHPDGQRLLLPIWEGTEALPLDGSPPTLYLPRWLPGPWLPDGRTQIVYDVGTYGPRVAPSRGWALAVDGVVQSIEANPPGGFGSWGSTPGVPLGLAADDGLVAYGNGVALRATGAWVYLTKGIFLGFAP